MKIDRLILQGFKSFGERTALEFGPGIFGIVGPNGSGKSNLVEALRWAVGARARELRGEEAQALLFHGSDGKAPNGFAEVSLEVLRDKQRLNLTRRLERDGSAEVRLNSSRATLKQIEQALMGTGLSRSGYAIVGQGEVGQILQAGPEVLLAYLEEAAGLKAVTQASKLTRERLESALSELINRSSEMEERKATIAEKAAQAEAARRAAELASRQLILKRSVLQARIREAEQEAKAASEKAHTLEAERTRVTERQKALEGEKSQALEQLEVAQNTHSEALRQAEALAGETRLVEQEQTSRNALLKRLAQDLAENETRLTRLRATPEPTAPTEAEPDSQALQALEGQSQKLMQAIREEENTLRRQQQAFEQYLRAQATYEAQKAAFEQSTQRLRSLEADQQRLEGEVGQMAQSLAQSEAREAELRSQLNDVVKQEGQLQADARAADAEAKRLGAVIQSGSDLSEGPKKAKQSGIGGVIGVVADLLEVPEGLELALEVAMGGRMQWVLTETEQAAQQAIEYLKQQGGRATFLSKTLLRAFPKPRRDYSKEAGAIGLARELVALPALTEALATLVGETLVMQTLEAALALSKKYPDAPRMVTLEGELLETSGALTGGRLQRGGQMLALRRRYQDASKEALHASDEAQTLTKQTQNLRQELQALGLESTRRQLANLQAELKATQANLARETQQLAPVAPQAVDVPNPLALEQLQAEREGLSQAASQTRELAARWQRYQEDLGRYKEGVQQTGEAEARLGQIRAEQHDLAEQLRASQLRRSELEAARSGLNLQALETALQAARQRTRALSEEETRLVVRTNGLVSDLEIQHLTQARREATIETLAQELAEVPQGPVQDGSSRSLARSLSETEQALAEIGPVNHLAEREYGLLSEDIGKLETALSEAQEAVAKLEVELGLVEGEYKQKLEGVFDTFRNKFSQYAEALLGAEAQLERIEGGLDLVLKPAGKRTVNLNLLSMGERTMGALAFLFALSEVGENGGLPIAVLDEVDAPLDEANIQRFCRFLRHFSSQTQFILVTHQKRTMEACDALYGVTTDRGISRVYSIKREPSLA